MTFEEFLVKKRIDKAAFEAGDPVRFTAWQEMYAQMHSNSFLIAVKMQINNIRLRYHLLEEEVAKLTQTATTAAKPVARRAVAKPAVPQETSESQSTAPKIRPVFKKADTAPKPEQAGADGADKAASPKPRPVIKRPVISKPDTAEHTEKPEETAKPAAKPRPVIKRPAALQKPASEEQDAKPDVKPEAETEHTAAAKPARPRPVIKRPTVLQKPDAVESKEVKEEHSPELNAEDQPKTPRPRPVIKRPVALQKPKPEEAEPVKGVGEAGSSGADEPKLKPPRPRPIIKRPTPANEAKQAEEQPKQQEEVPDKPKSPRPRPIIKRPVPKPDAGETGTENTNSKD